VCVSQYTIRAADAACTANSLDIVLCLDVSTSIVDNVLRKDSAQTFARSLTSQYTLGEVVAGNGGSVGDKKTRIAVLHFADDVKEVSPTFQHVESDIRNQIYAPTSMFTSPWATNTPVCVQKAVQLFTSTDGRDVADAARVIVILTDGQPTTQDLAASTAKAKENGIAVVVVALEFGPDRADTTNLRRMASNPCPETNNCLNYDLTGSQCSLQCDDRFIHVNTFSDLNTAATRSRVVAATCIQPGCQYQWTPFGDCLQANGGGEGYSRERTSVPWLEPGGNSPSCPTAADSRASKACAVTEEDVDCVCDSATNVPWDTCHLSNPGTNTILQERRCVPVIAPVGSSSGSCRTLPRVRLVCLFFVAQTLGFIVVHFFILC
jgi:hypothetical protein